MILPAKTVKQMKSLSAEEMMLVSNLVDHLYSDSSKNKKHIGIIGFCGLISLKLSEILSPKDSMTDDEVDDIIADIRKNNRANRR